MYNILQYIMYIGIPVVIVSTYNTDRPEGEGNIDGFIKILNDYILL